jgi:hypothetical protein
MRLRAELLASSLLHGRPLGRSAQSTPARRASASYALGDPGRPSRVPSLLIAIFDNSGSVVCPTGTDPLSNRFAEVTRAFTAVAQRGSRRELGAVLHFDAPCSGDVGPVPLTRTGLLMLRAGLRVPPDGAGTSDLGPSLLRAVGLAEALPGHRATLVVLSDFLLTDANPDEVLRQLAAFPGDVHAVALGGRLQPDSLDERITVTRVERGDPPGAVARAVFASLITHRRGSRRGCELPGA